MENNYRILVVDDDPDIRKTYEQILIPGKMDHLLAAGESNIPRVSRMKKSCWRPRSLP